MGPQSGCEFLCVDDFIGTLVSARALKNAFELGLIDYLGDKTDATVVQLETALPLNRPGLDFLLDLLSASGVIDRTRDTVACTSAFRRALNFRDLLETKLDLANLAAADFLEHFAPLVQTPAVFQRQSRIFDLFDYRRCLEFSPENYERTRRWMRFTTCLSKYEAQACLGHHDFSVYNNGLDIGGNSGEFMRQICSRHADFRATIFDLPLVCANGEEHVRCQPEAERIAFVPGNALVDPLPTGVDLVVFKSMLHDWPEAEAKRLLTRASHCLRPGGTLLIFERGPVAGSGLLSYANIPMLLFFRSFRSPAFYQNHLEVLGFPQIAVEHMELDMPWFIVAARLR